MILAFMLLGALVNTSTELPLRCATNARVTHAIADLGKLSSEIGDPLAVLLNDPVIAACHLVRSLHVVHETHVVGYEQDKHAKTMRVIWALRALRYLTHCQDFRAPTADNPTKWDEVRRDFLLRDDTGAPVENWKRTDGVPFFATWMSRDSVFIAPRDAQEKIIMQWVRWYRDEGSRGFHFQACESVDWWYF
jgi:hypothetical protein